MKRISFILYTAIAMIATSCTADAIAQEELVKEQPPKQIVQSNTYTVVWYSNQINPYVEFSKRTLINCVETDVVFETHRENRFDITLNNGQLFDLQIKRESSVANPELYLAIYKGDELQYEQEITTAGFMMINYIDYNGNIGK